MDCNIADLSKLLCADIDRLCYENGLLSRGGCTDRTWASASCAPFCNNTVIHNPVNLFSCHKPSIFQCGTGNGPGDCSANFTLPIQNIILRADQEPGAQNAVNFSDPSATFVNKDALNSTNTAPPNLNTTAIASGDTGPSVTAVGLGIGLPLGFLLLVSLGIIIWQERRIQHSKKYPTKVNQVDLMRAAQAANSSRDQIARPGPYTWRGGDMPTNLQGSVDRNLSLQIPQQSGSLNGSRNDDAHELYSPVRTEPRSGV